MKAKEKAEWMKPASVGPQFVVAIVLGWFFGHEWLDPMFGTEPWMTVIFTGFGVIAGFLNLFREVSNLNTQSRKHAESQMPASTESGQAEPDPAEQQDKSAS